MIHPRFLLYLFTFALVVVVSAGAAHAQVPNRSTSAYQDWKDKNVSQASDHAAISFALSKVGTGGATVEMTVGVGQNITELAPLEFKVQPLFVKTLADGKVTFEPVGNPSSLKMGKLTWERASTIVATPSVTFRVPPGTGAVRISILGFGGPDQESTIVLALKDSVSTGVLGRPGL